MKTVKLVNVTKTFGDVTAVDNLSLSVPQESIYGFIGPNGITSIIFCKIGKR